MKPAAGTAQASDSPWPAIRKRFEADGFAPLRFAPFALFVVGILAYGAVFAWYTLDRFDLLNLVRDGFRDDAFYYFQIAYHMAEGRFSTFDGIARTNGYHPMWLFALTPLYWVFDKTEALFAVKAFEIMLIAGGVALAAVAARVARLPWILLFAALPALYARNGMLLGMESALALFTLGLLMLVACFFATDPARWRWPLAAVAFALPWARLEYAAIAVAVTAALCFLEWSGRFSCSSSAAAPRTMSSPGRRGSPALVAAGAIPIAAALAGVLVYFAYNGVVFGGIVPVSGAIKALSSQAEWRKEGGYDLAESFHAFVQSRFYDDELLIALEVCAYALLVWWLSRRFRSREGGLLLAFMVGCVGLAIGHLAQFAWEVLFMHPDVGLRNWYFAPAYLMTTLVVPVRCFVGIHLLRCILGRRLPRATQGLCLVGVVAAGAVCLAHADFAKPFRVVDGNRNQEDHGPNVHLYMGALVMGRLLPKDALVGSWMSGIVGYFSGLSVMDLDGLVYGYKRTLEDGGSDDDAVDYERLGVSYIGDIYLNTAYEVRPSGYSLLFQLHQTPRDHRHDYHIALDFNVHGLDDDPPASGRFAERMAPHVERQADGTGLLASGRLAQAFATECAADEVAEWTFDARVGADARVRAISTWTRTADGSCVSATVLPHGHLPPLRVRRAPLAEAVTGWAEGRPPAIRADANNGGGFDVYLVGSRLLYVREVCGQGDVETPFFLELVQVGDDFEETGLAASRNFLLKDYGNWVEDGHCLADVPLPNGSGAVIRTGQYTADGRVWAGDIPLDLPRTAQGVGLWVGAGTAQAFATECAADEVVTWTFGATVGAVDTWTRSADGSCSNVVALPDGHAQPVRARREAWREAVASLSGGRPPAVRGDSAHLGGFDVWLAGNALIYAREACGQADAETPFFLHLVPAGDDFDDGRAPLGYNNADFMLEHRGGWSGEDGSPCLARVPLPRYGIAEIRTGQYIVEDFRRVWEGVIGRDQLTTEGG